MLKDIANVFHHTKSQVRGLCVGADIIILIFGSFQNYRFVPKAVVRFKNFGSLQIFKRAVCHCAFSWSISVSFGVDFRFLWSPPAAIFCLWHQGLSSAAKPQVQTWQAGAHLMLIGPAIRNLFAQIRYYTVYMGLHGIILCLFFCLPLFCMSF